jgi:O-antigen/teichoic acid export membrane protein
VAGSLALLSTAVSPLVVPLLFGDGFNAQPGIVALVAAAGCLGGLYYLVATPLLLSDSTMPLVWLSLGSVLVNLALNVALIPGAGAWGAAIATFCSYVLLCLGAGVASRRVPPREVPA